MAGNHQNVALIGASGNLGSKTLDALVKQGKNNVTVITRPTSTIKYPPRVQVKKGEYKDAAFLESALHGQDVLVIMLGFGGLPDQDAIIQAAAKAGVRYLLPTEYGAPSGNEKQIKAVELIKIKRDVHDQIEQLGMKWVGVVTNPWIDYSLQYGAFSISIPERKATLYTDATPFATTTIAKVAAGIAAFLALPATAIEKDFANNYLYLSSFVIRQPEIFAAVLRVTGTTEADWQVERKKTQDLVDEGHKMVNAGDMAGHFKILYGVSYQPGMGGDYSDLLHNEMLGLGEENLDEVVKAAADAARPGGWEAASTLAV